MYCLSAVRESTQTVNNKFAQFRIQWDIQYDTLNCLPQLASVGCMTVCIM